ncbi:esterase family protein [Leifsonia shinshuensis]|uniref:alpha/beta hydrolase n=1 Tax=Leifsonia shinshuensis TaxID=150026 RepID=UPI001F510C1D|nr:alpha/beta fold hydrolase [Leifsonia shinshuensis]MCI0158346.1 esterase family protein [Leifsonia shinshuensis]
MPYALLVLSGVLTGVLITQVGLRQRQDPHRRLVGVLVALCIGEAIGALVFWVVAVGWNPFGIPVPRSIAAYAAGFGGSVAIAALSIHRARWWRALLAALTVGVVLVTGTLASSAAFGVNPTLGSLFGVTPTSNAADQTALVRPVTTKPVTDIAKSWTPPRGLPKHGKTSSVKIPARHSGFHARDAGLYLPPAALMPNAPRLPLMILMMGQPGNPDPQYVGSVLDQFAARNHGLAPIVVVADQLGDPTQDPGCTDTAHFGEVETYITVDVLDWARQHLNVDPSGSTTTIAGYSNGGACAMLFASKYPDDFRNVVDISGELFPGAEDPAAMLDSVFAGNQAAYDAQKPATNLAGHAHSGLAIFTAGSNDPFYVQSGQQAQKLFQQAGFETEFAEVPNGGHVLGAIYGGFNIAFSALYPSLGLKVAVHP